MQASTLDIVLPCYNPQPGWEKIVIDFYKKICTGLPYIKIQVIIINDGSSKNISNLEITEIKNAIPLFNYIEYVKNKGKGFALRKGIEASTAELCIYTDIDFPYTVESFLQIFQALYKNECDVAAGIKNKSYYNTVPVTRKFISRLLRWCIQSLLRVKITDTQCGLKGFRENVKPVFLQTTINRYLFDLEFIFIASHNKMLTLKPVEVTLREGVTFTMIPNKILVQEVGNFMKIVLRSIFTR